MSCPRACGYAALAVFMVTLVVGCEQEMQGISHPTDRLHYPTYLAADPSGDYVYVVNSNFDVRYRTGSVVAIDLDTHELVPETAIGVGSFGGQLALYETGDEEHRLAGYMPSRSDRKLSWFYVNGAEGEVPSLECRVDLADEPDDIPECQDEFTVEDVRRKRLPQDDEGLDDDEKAERAGEPVDLRIGLDALGATVYYGKHGEGDYLTVANPRTGLLHLLHIGGGLPTDTEVPGQPAARGFDPDHVRRSAPGEPVLIESVPTLGGVYGASVSPLDGWLYTTSKYSNALVPFRITSEPDPDGEDRNWARADDLSAAYISKWQSSNDFARGLVFNRDGTRAFVAYRNPSSLVVLDTSANGDGVRANRFVGSLDLGQGPAEMALAASGPDGRDLLYVVCFNDEQIYVVDPTLLEVVDIIEVEGGPYDIEVVDDPEKGRRRAYVTVFQRDAIAVIELDRVSPFFHQVVAYVRGVHDEGVR